MFKIKQELLDKIGSYLADRPWIEVQDILKMMQNPEFIQPVKEEKVDKPEDKKE